jgi:hypothetical protein
MEDSGISKQTSETISKTLENIRTFNSKSKIRQACLGYLSKHFLN